MKIKKLLFAAFLCAGFQAQATTYNISTVGSISTFTLNNSSGALSASNGVGFGSVQGLASVSISGTINAAAMAALKMGDVITLPITAGSGSTYYVGSLQFVPTLTMSNGAVFNITSSNGTISLTVTAVPTSTGIVIFTINANGGNLMLQNTSSTSTTLTLSGQSITFPNTVKSQNLTNQVSQNIAFGANACVVAVAPMTIITAVYNQLLTTGSVANSPISLTQNYVQVTTIPANSNILAVGLGNGAIGKVVNSKVLYDVMSDTSGLNNDYNTVPATTTALTQVTLAPNLPPAQIETYMESQPTGSYAIVQNSDGSYTIAVNWGPLEGGFTGIQYTAADVSSVSNYPNTAANNAANQNMLNQAIALKLASENFRTNFAVELANCTIATTITPTTQSNLIAGTVSGSVTSKPDSNTAAGQTSITVNYVNLNGKPLATVTQYAGWSSDNILGQTPTAAQLVTPATIAGYALVTKATILDTITSIPQSQILTGDSTVAFPLTAVGTVNLYYVYATPKTLPVTGMHLTAQAQGTSSLLSWTTLTEINNKGFSVQRSVDGVNWTTLGFVNSAALNGNSSVPLVYSYTDIAPLNGVNYYRLVQTDLDGNTALSNVASVQFGNGSGWKVYPNPVKSGTPLNITVPDNAAYELITADGKIARRGSLQTGNNQINTSGLASDIYFLRITANGQRTVYEVQVVR